MTRIYKPQKLGLAFPRLYDIAYAENVASGFLQVFNISGAHFPENLAINYAILFVQLNPDVRLEAEEALHHKYFSDLPPKIYELPHGKLTHFT